MRRSDYVIASGLFTPPLDVILHNAGYVYLGQLADAYADETRQPRIRELPGMGKRRWENVRQVMLRPGLVVPRDERIWLEP